MTRLNLRAVACVTLLCAGMAFGKTTPQQQCDSARIRAWAKYQSCVETVEIVVANAPGLGSTAFAKCRHTYFTNWTTFQTKGSLATSTCIGSRFADNGDGTVTDNLSGLVWEKKTTDASVHDKGNVYTWSTGSNNEDGTAFTGFLGTVNSGGGFGGANGWRLPTLAELQTIVLDFACTGAFGGGTCQCGSNPCVAFDASNTQSNDNSFPAYYWSATSYVPVPQRAWIASFDYGSVGFNLKTRTFPSLTYVRAVRGGL